MVSYWKTKDFVEAKVMQHPDGHYVMHMQGEKYPFPGHPRGVLLYGSLSPLKHQIKNQVFNACWKMLELEVPAEQIREYLSQTAWPNIYTLAEQSKYDMLPPDKFVPAVKELYRAMTKVGVDERLRDIICFILQEDDAYRMRFQWLAKFFPLLGKPTLKHFERALEMAEQAEVVGDMKERQRLFKRIFLFMANEKFTALLKEVDWKKVGLTAADKYFFRAKYYKVDYPEYQY